jgi:hypothetical protein
VRLGLLPLVLGLHDRGGDRRPPTAVPPAAFLVTSPLVPGETPLSYSPVRSLYSADERLEQTCLGLESIRERAPGSFVILLENSSLTTTSVGELAKRVDWLVLFDSDPLAVALRDGEFKGAAEAFMLLCAMAALRSADYRILLKLSGRYRLSDRFELGRFPTSGFGVCLSGGVPSTRLYSVAKDGERRYVRQLRRALWLTSRGRGIEQVLFQGIPTTDLNVMDAVGVHGLVAVSGDVIDE